MIVLDIPFPISSNNAYFNRKKGGRAPTNRLRTWRQAAGWDVRKQSPRPVHGPYTLSIHLIVDDNRKRDCGNFEKVVSDLLVEHGLVDDDSECVALNVSKFRGAKKGCTVIVNPSNGVPDARDPRIAFAALQRNRRI